MDFTIVYVLGTALMLVAALYYLLQYLQRRQRAMPRRTTSALDLAASIYVGQFVGKVIGFVIAGIVLAYFFWPR